MKNYLKINKTKKPLQIKKKHRINNKQKLIILTKKMIKM